MRNTSLGSGRFLRARVLAFLALLTLSIELQAGSILREVYTEIGGESVAGLTSSPNYPDSPTFREVITGFFEAPRDVLDNYGQRLRGWILPPSSGDYTFWIASDDNSELWLSTDETPENAIRIAGVTSWTQSRDWEAEPGQRSSPVRLEQGQRYWVAALHKEGGGGDNLAVRWLRPDGIDEAPISADHLLPWGTSFTGPIIAGQPADTTAAIGTVATFQVSLSNTDASTFAWTRNGEPIPGASASRLDVGPVSLADDGARFQCRITSAFGSEVTREAVLTLVWPGSLLREVYTDIGGVTVADLTNSPKYPDQPDLRSLLTELFEAPMDVLDNYGQRLHGWITPPTTGDYTFWISSDDGSELWLSTDADPAHQVVIARVAAWTPSRAWDWEEGQRSAPIRLEAGQRYSIMALQKEGGGGDNLAVRWLRPDGMDEAPIPSLHLLPFGTSFSGPWIAQQPVDATTTETRTAQFEVRAGNFDFTLFQWQKDGVDIPGATSSTLVLSNVPLSAHNTRYRAVLTTRFGTTTSDAGTLRVNPDTQPPTVLRVSNVGANQVRVIFSEPVAAATATVASRYRLTPSLAITAATFGDNPSTILLTTVAPLRFGTLYRLTINGVTDTAATPNPIAPGNEASFTALEYVPTPVGTGSSLPSEITPPSGDQFDVRGGGSGIGGTTDQFEFFQKQRTGDFDVRVRVATVQVTDPSFLAGIMARESLAADSTFAGVFASSPQLGTVFSVREAVGTTTRKQGGVPVNYPYTWLRLRRSGNTFSGFAGFDGSNWIALGSAQIPMPATVFFGMSVASRNPSQSTLVQFRQLGTSIRPVEVAAADWGEPAGPSSPFTGLVFSEIQYHPADRTDGRELEFVEIYNAGDLFEDLSGMALSGDIAYTFPAGTRLEAGDYLVVARVPADLQAVYPGLSRVLGPYTGSLPNDRGQLRLRNELNAMVLEVNYADRQPWPAAADGSGHSLSLVRPSYGEDDPRAWAASIRFGGSPGGMDARIADPHADIIINEFLALPTGTAEPFIEIHNRGKTSVSLAGCRLGTSPGLYPAVLPTPLTLAPGGFYIAKARSLGLILDPSGGFIFLVNPSQTRAIDAIRYDGQLPGVATGRFPDGDASIRLLRAPTPGGSNQGLRPSSVVLNELMYNPISGNSDDEFVELHNPSPSQPVNVGGWRLLDGITYTIPAETVIPPAGYLVVAKNKSLLLSRHAHLNNANTVGNYSGSLRNSGERVALAFPTTASFVDATGATITRNYNVIDCETTYLDGGRWGDDADGNGSSLELRDPRADTTQASSWAASDESAKAPWTTISATGVMDLGNDAFQPDQLQITLQGGGECLIDDVEVLRADGSSVLENGSFEAGTGSWIVQGNHSLSRVEPDPSGTAGNVFHLRTAGRGDTGLNRIFSPLTSTLTPGDPVTLRARVRWLRGWPEVLLRLRGNWIELGGRMDLPAGLGTPGLRNSRFVANAGPSIANITQSPILPAPGQPVTVSARVTDPDGIFAVMLHYRIDPDPTVVVLRMTDDGRTGDARAGDRIYTAIVPAQGDGALVAWRIVATDLVSNRVNPNRATASYPDYPIDSEALIRWGEPQPFGTFGHYHFWMTQDQFNDWRSGGGLNNTPRPVTLVYGRHRLVHGATVRDKGSPFHGGFGDFVFDLPKDGMLLGEDDLLLAAPGNQGNDDARQREQIAYWILRKLGAPYLHRRFVATYLNGARQYEIMEQAQEPNRSIAEAWFSEGDSGDLYKIEDWFEFTDDAGGFSSRDATLERFTTTGDVLKPARYRWSWRKRAVDGSANDFTSLFGLVDAVNAPDPAYVPGVLGLVDVNEWMRVFALQRIVGNWDSYGMWRGKNSYLYKRSAGPHRIFAWDIDFVLGLNSNGPTDGLWGSNDPAINRMYDTPAFRRLLWAAYQDAVDGPLTEAQVGPQLDARYAALVANDIPATPPQPIRDYIRARSDFIQSQLAAWESPVFAITTNGGNDFSTEETSVALEGVAPFGVASLRVNGAALPVVWLGDQTWRIQVPLTQTVTLLEVSGLDLLGNPVPGATDQITVTTTETQPEPGNGLIVTEIMYQPLPAGSGGNLFEFLELRNSGTRSLNLSGAAFTEGITFPFPDGTVLAPGAYFVLARDLASFATRYPGATAQGAYSGQLDNGGEQLVLKSAGGDTLISFAYDDVSPWPTSPDGTGPSLQRIDLAPNSSNGPENWGAGPATPGSSFASPSLAGDSGRSGASPIRAAGLATTAKALADTGGASELSGAKPRIVQIIPLAGGGLRIRAQGQPSTAYRLRAASSLAPAATWTDLGVASTDADGFAEFQDPLPGTHTARFYQFLAPSHPLPTTTPSP